jgi:hypothetical protein
LNPFGSLQVEGNTLLVGVEVEKKTTLLGIRLIIRKRTHPPGNISTPRILYLYYIGTGVSQKLGAVRSGNIMGEVQYPRIEKCHLRHNSSRGTDRKRYV